MQSAAERESFLLGAKTAFESAQFPRIQMAVYYDDTAGATASAIGLNEGDNAPLFDAYLQLLSRNFFSANDPTLPLCAMPPLPPRPPPPPPGPPPPEESFPPEGAIYDMQAVQCGVLAEDGTSHCVSIPKSQNLSNPRIQKRLQQVFGSAMVLPS